MGEHTLTIRHDPDYHGEARFTSEDGVRVLTFGSKDPTPSARTIVTMLRDLAEDVCRTRDG
jgi:hypothetical protein